MRAALVVALVAIFATHVIANDRTGPWPWTHARWANEPGRRLLVEGARRSALIKGILDNLERTDVIVFVIAQMSPSGESEAAKAHLCFATAAGGIRYLHVTVDTWRAGEWDSIPLLGHELQHALEVAAAPEVRDVRSFEALYSRIGWQSGAVKFETDLARVTGRRIQSELLWAKARPWSGKE
jgi:hypothetical protein